MSFLNNVMNKIGDAMHSDLQQPHGEMQNMHQDLERMEQQSNQPGGSQSLDYNKLMQYKQKLDHYMANPKYAHYIQKAAGNVPGGDAFFNMYKKCDGMINRLQPRAQQNQMQGTQQGQASGQGQGQGEQYARADFNDGNQNSSQYGRDQNQYQNQNQNQQGNRDYNSNYDSNYNSNQSSDSYPRADMNDGSYQQGQAQGLGQGNLGYDNQNGNYSQFNKFSDGDRYREQGQGRDQEKGQGQDRDMPFDKNSSLGSGGFNKDKDEFALAGADSYDKRSDVFDDDQALDTSFEENSPYQSQSSFTQHRRPSVKGYHPQAGKLTNSYPGHSKKLSSSDLPSQSQDSSYGASGSGLGPRMESFGNHSKTSFDQRDLEPYREIEDHHQRQNFYTQQSTY